MFEFLTENGVLLGSTFSILLPLAYAVKGRIISDKNMLATFQSAKKGIEDNLNIKFNVQEKINAVSKSVDKMESEINNAVQDVNESITKFMESELYTKMLSGLSQLDELNKTLQNKDATIETLSREIKETNLRYQEILNELKKG